MVVGVQEVYDGVAQAYDRQFGDELAAKPLDRALLTGFVELVGRGRIADVGCGPGHVTRFLATQHPDVIGIDLSPDMIGIARERSPEMEFTVASMLALPASDRQWAGVVALYSIIHLDCDERGHACREFARVIHPGGWLLVAFHVDSHEFAAGQVNHLTSWFGQRVELDGLTALKYRKLIPRQATVRGGRCEPSNSTRVSHYRYQRQRGARRRGVIPLRRRQCRR